MPHYLSPYPYLARIPWFRRLWVKIPFGPLKYRYQYDIWDRPNYAFGIHSAATLASKLRLTSISVIEFGVAGGNGLRAMERISETIGENLGVKIDVYGFDSGGGMPAPVDYRDLPHVWREGFFRMDIEKLRSVLTSARLIIGDVAHTVPQFLSSADVAPIGFVSFDLDYYSSTKEAFRVFGAVPQSRLPRVHCYFDDIIGPEEACYNDYVGELCAIREFNEEHDTQKIAKFPNLSWLRSFPARWNEQMYVFHDFEHPLYGEMVRPQGQSFRELPLE